MNRTTCSVSTQAHPAPLRLPKVPSDAIRIVILHMYTCVLYARVRLFVRLFLLTWFARLFVPFDVRVFSFFS